MEGLVQLVPLLPVVLPLLGKLLLMAPFVPNKAIPFINAAVATAAKYWFLTFGTELGAVPVPVPGDVGANDITINMAGFLGDFGKGVLSLAWGSVDALAAHYFYEGKRLIAAKTGATSWLERGKRSVF